MTFLNSTNTPSPNPNFIILDNFITVQAAAEVTGYNIQYLRRLLRAGKLGNIKVGQIWLIKLDSLGAYIQKIRGTKDHRFGPRNIQISTVLNSPHLQLYANKIEKGE